MASLSSGGKIRRKSRKPLKLEAPEEVSRGLLVFGGSAGTVLSLSQAVIIVVQMIAMSLQHVMSEELLWCPHAPGKDVGSMIQHVKSMREEAKSVGRCIAKYSLLS